MRPYTGRVRTPQPKPARNAKGEPERWVSPFLRRMKVRGAMRALRLTAGMADVPK